MNIRHLSHLRTAFLCAAISMLCPLAQADIVISAVPVTAGIGSTGDQFDVLLTNDGAGSLTVSGFSFGISVADPYISFTGATTSTVVPYIFGANSVFGPDLTGATTGPSLATSDLYAVPLAGVSVGPGSTAGLGRVSFDVRAGATPGTFPVIFSGFPTTSLSDPNALDIPISTLTSGSITISGATPVPEPSTGVLIFGTFLLTVLPRLRRSRICSRSN